MTQLLAPNGKPSNLTPEQYKLVRTPAFKKWFGDWENLALTKINDSGIDEVSLKRLEDGVSKVVDENGEPLVCRHYSQKPNKFNEFTKQKPNDTRNFISFAKEGFYFSTANKYSIEKIYNRSKKGLLYEVFLNIKNILDLGNYNAYDFITKKAVNWKEFTFEMLQKYVIKGRVGSFDDYTEYNVNVNAFWIDEIDEKAKNKIFKLGYKGVWGDKDKYADSISDEFYGTDQIVVFDSNQIKLADGTNTTFDSKNPDIRYAEGGNLLLAPNGKPSNLTAEQYKLVRTPEFKAWFGDWENDIENSSKVIDEETKEPLVVFHGTNTDFTIFKTKKRLDSINNPFYESGLWFFAPSFDKQISEEERDYSYEKGNAEYMAKTFMDNKDDKGNYIDNKVIKVFLNVRNPKIIDSVTDRQAESLKYYSQEMRKLKNNDAIIMHGSLTDGNMFRDDINVLNSNQIKLADGTNTIFNAGNPDIRYNDGGVLENELSIIIKGVTNENKYKGNYKKIFDLIEENITFYNPYGTSFEELKNNDFYINITPKPESIIIEKISKLKGVEIINPDIRFELGGSIPKELYHYTSETNFDRIFDSNILNPSQKYGNRLSFTSDSEYHKKEHGLDYGNINVRITFDNEKLISDGYSFFPFDHSSKQNKIGKEFEYIISTPIKNVKNYIKNITIFKGNAIAGEIDKTSTDYANKYYLKSDIQYADGGNLLLAPNGKPSNLSPEQYELVRTPAFKKWFGDWENLILTKINDSGIDEVSLKRLEDGVSKVVDSNGEPLLVYHSSKIKFNIFEKEKISENFEYSFGFHFSNNIEDSKKYGKITNSFFLKITNPFVFNVKDKSNGSVFIDINRYDAIHEIVKSRKTEKEIDGVIAYSSINGYVTMYSNQIKLTDGTNTTFDSNNPDIRFNEGGSVIINPTEIECHKCHWKWKVKDGGDDLFICHKCYTDNSKFYKFEGLTAEKMLENPLTIKYLKDLDDGEGWWVDTFHAKTKNYLPNTYYHLNTSGSNAGVGKGLYLGRDKNALISFYGIQDGIENDFDTHLLDTYLGNPNWLDLINYDDYEKIKKEALDKYELPIILKGLEELDAVGELIKKLTLEKGYDGIRYYDPNATGEEFVLFNTEKLKKIPNTFKKGGRTIAQTPAPKKDQIKGSDKNKEGSAKDISSAKKIKFSDDVLEKIQNSVDKHNKKHSNKKITIDSAKAVVRRGMGAYSSTHRPTISGGNENSRVAWGLARLNAFMYKIVNGKSKSGKYSQDNDLIEELGYKVEKYEIGGIFQGTPHDFDKYSTDYIGKGEGLQVFGWGLYFTDIKDIAKNYAKNEMLIQKEISRKSDDFGLLVIYTNISDNVVDKLGYLKYKLKEFEDKKKEYKIDIWDDNIEKYSTLIDIIQNYQGKIYSVTLFKGEKETDYNLIKWEEKPSKKILRLILKQFDKEGIYYEVNEYRIKFKRSDGITMDIDLVNGNTLYNGISSIFFSNDKEASLFLLRAGIDGIKYKSGTLSGMSDKEGYNYVIFDANDITIEGKEKYADGGDIQAYEEAIGITYAEGGNLLLAPNGKPSNLTPEQYKLVRTPAFKKWFGDWQNDTANASKILDYNGEPLVCHHGTYREYTSFDINKVGNTDKGFFSKGFYFTPNQDLARYYGNKVYKCFLNIKNPITTKSREDLANYLGLEYNNNTYSEIARDKIVSLKYDGVLQEYDLPIGVKALYPFIEIVAYYPEQIKLADGSNTTFDGNNPDIRFDNGGETDEPTHFWGTEAGGVLVYCSTTERYLILLRSKWVLEPNTWGIISGKLDDEENVQEAVLREAQEETGHKLGNLIPSFIFEKPNFKFHNFVSIVEEEFTPELDWENTDYRWVKLNEMPENLHFGLKLLLQKEDLPKLVKKNKMENEILIVDINMYRYNTSVNFKNKEIPVKLYPPKNEINFIEWAEENNIEFEQWGDIEMIDGSWGYTFEIPLYKYIEYMKTEKFYTGGELKKGIKTEMEHKNTIKKIKTGDYTLKESAKLIAKDHLEENDKYYTHLSKMEKQFGEGGLTAKKEDFNIPNTESLIELVYKERENKIKEWKRLGEKVVIGRNDGYSWEDGSTNDNREIATKPSRAKVIEIIKNNPNVTEIHFYGTIKSSERVGFEMEIIDDFDVLLWSKEDNFFKKGLTFEYIRDNGKYKNTIIDKSETIEHKERKDSGDFLYYKSIDKYGNIGESRVYRDVLQEDFDNGEAIFVNKMEEGGGIKNTMNILYDVESYIKNETKRGILETKKIEDGYISYSSRISPNVSEGKEYDELVEHTLSLKSKLNKKFGKTIDVEMEYVDEWVGLEITQKNIYEEAKDKSDLATKMIFDIAKHIKSIASEKNIQVAVLTYTSNELDEKKFVKYSNVKFDYRFFTRDEMMAIGQKDAEEIIKKAIIKKYGKNVNIVKDTDSFFSYLVYLKSAESSNNEAESKMAEGGKVNSIKSKKGDIKVSLDENWYSDDTKVELVPVSELIKFREFDRKVKPKYNKDNSRDNINHLKYMFEKNGVKEPLIIEYSAQDNAVLVIEGNHRINSAIDLGMEYLPARVVLKKYSKFSPSQLKNSMKVNGIKANSSNYIPSDLKPSQIGIAGAKPIYADGGIIEGRLHSECGDDGCGRKFQVGENGHIIEAERDEAVIVADAFESNEELTIKGTPSEVASALNVIGGGKNFDKGATIIKNGSELEIPELKNQATNTDVDDVIDPSSIIINRRSMADTKKYEVTGTPKQIASAINSINGNGVVIENGAEIKEN